jgi:hypothetical protein
MEFSFFLKTKKKKDKKKKKIIASGTFFFIFYFVFKKIYIKKAKVWQKLSKKVGFLSSLIIDIYPKLIPRK